MTPSWHRRATRKEIEDVAMIDRILARYRAEKQTNIVMWLRRQRDRIVNRAHMRTDAWVEHRKSGAKHVRAA